MNGRFQRISDLFEHARQLPDAAARSSYLDAECEAEMRAEVNALLAAYDEDRGRDPRRDSAVLPGLGEAVAAAWNTTQSEPAAPELVEGFRILERIGSGGMGTVYAAQQIEPARRVALKVLRPEADRDRFRREVLALARLQHPGIAQILLSGECATPAGKVPFLAMELIDGVPVDRFAQSLGRPARVDLLIRIAEAVAHAHRRGIIHRDLKPSNILVTPDGQPKVLDFGLARATDDSDDGFGRQTKTGHLVGTLAYMSPEQASGARDAVDTRADIYALGVIGYEVLTGKLPHALDDLPLQRALQTLTDTDPEGIPDLRGDLWIILRKALAKDPEMRYGSASALASDLRRYRSDEPITARAPSTMYQLQKFVRRHKAPVFGAIATILALVVGLVLAVRAAGREADERIRADLERDAARAAAAHAYLRAATGDMATHEYGSARRHLDNIPPSFRDWEWAYLASRLDRSVEFRPFPAGADAETVLRGETAAHAPSGRIFGHRFRVRQSTLTDEANGATLELAGITLPIRSVRGSKDGRLLAVTTGQDAQNTQRIHVFDAATGAPVRTVLGSVGANGVVDFDGNGARIVFGGFRGWTVAYEIASGRRLFAFHNHGGDDTSAVAFGPGDRIATGGFDRSVHVLDARTGEILHVLRGHSGKIRGLVFTPDGRSVVSSAEDGTIRIWDIAAERLLDVIAVPTQYVGPLALDATGHDLWAMCGDGYRRYRLDGSKLDRFRVHDTFVYAVAFHPDGRTLATGSHGQGVRVVDTATGAALSPRADRRVWDLAFHPDGTLYSTSHRYAAPSWTAMRTDAMPNGGRALAIAPDGSRVVGGAGRADALRLYRPASGEIEAEWEGTPRSIEALAFSAEGKHVALGTKSGILEVRAVPSGTVVFQAAYRKKIYGVAFHPTRPRVAVGVDREIHIRDWRTGATVAELVGHRDIVWELIYHPSGTRLFSASHDTTVRVWDPESGREKLRLPGHRNYVHDLALSPDGRTLATASGDYHVRIFSTRPFAERWAEAHE